MRQVMEQAILSKLEMVKGPDSQGNYTALCPFHDDYKTPNLSVNFVKGCYNCFACGSNGHITRLAQRLGVVETQGETKAIVATAKPGITRYPIRDTDGKLIDIHVRRDGPRGKSFHWERPDGQIGLGGLRVSDLPLYGSEHLSGLADGAVVVLSEGEKAREALVSRGIPAVATVTGGAGTPGMEALHPLTRLTVVLWADNDDPGRSHMDRIAARLRELDYKDARLVDWTDAPLGGDAADAVVQGVDVDSLLQRAAPMTLGEAESLAVLLEDVKGFIGRYVATGDAQLAAITLWIAHCWAFEAAECTPYLHITSPEKQSGKTRLLESLALLVSKPWFTCRVSAAVLVRKVAHEAPTLLLDETDSAFKAEAEYSEALRGILNAGYRRGGVASLCVKSGGGFELVDFPTFCPKALAGIGQLPDTVADRSIRISLKRRAPSEIVERFRLRNARVQAKPLWERLDRWANVAAVKLADACPTLPKELSDRAADVWEPLLAIADLAGDAWPSRAREAALVLSDVALENGFSLGVRLLHDIREVLGDRTGSIPSTELVSALVGMEESPWGDLKGRPLDARRLSRLLRPYGIRSGTIRAGTATSKGYYSEAFADAWQRYCACTTEIAVTSVTSVTHSKPKANSRTMDVTDVTDVTLPGGIQEEPSNSPEAVLGMPVQEALEIWRSEGAPVIPLRPGENCPDLEKLLSNPKVLNRHLEAVNAWLDKRANKRGDGGQ